MAIGIEEMGSWLFVTKFMFLPGGSLLFGVSSVVWDCLWFNDFGFVVVFVLFELGTSGGDVIRSGLIRFF